MNFGPSRPWLAPAWLLFCAVLAAGSSAATEPVRLSGFSADYQLTHGNFSVGEAHVSLHPGSDGVFDYRRESRTTGLVALFRKDHISETSRWRFAGDTIQPLQYDYRRTGKKPRNVRVVFDWEKRRVRNALEGDSWGMTIPEGTLDKLVVQLAVMLDLQRRRDTLEYPIADGGHLKTWRFERLGEETLETPAGRFRAIKIKRQRDDRKRTTYLWCAPELNYLPVRIDQEEKGERFSMVVTRIEGLPQS
jgi:hypothetical protein